MGRLSNSIDLAKSSLAVLSKDKDLAVIPAVSAVACGVMPRSSAGRDCTRWTHLVNPAPGQNEYTATPATWAIGDRSVCFSIGFIAQFFAAVLIAGANERLEGGNPTIGSAFSKAELPDRLHPRLVGRQPTVGMILQAIREKAGILGVAVSRLVGAAWNVITWLAVPIIIVEGVGPIDAIKRSVPPAQADLGRERDRPGRPRCRRLRRRCCPGMIVAGLPVSRVARSSRSVLFLSGRDRRHGHGALGAIYRTALYRFAVGLPTAAPSRGRSRRGLQHQDGVSTG